jgi:hypothetical protein
MLSFVEVFDFDGNLAVIANSTLTFLAAEKKENRSGKWQPEEEACLIPGMSLLTLVSLLLSIKEINTY